GCTAYSRITVFPDPVGAATSTPSPALSAAQAATWKSSKAKSYCSRKAVNSESAWRLRNWAYRCAGEEADDAAGVLMAPDYGTSGVVEMLVAGGREGGPPATH